MPTTITQQQLELNTLSSKLIIDIILLCETKLDLSAKINFSYYLTYCTDNIPVYGVRQQMTAMTVRSPANSSQTNSIKHYNTLHNYRNVVWQQHYLYIRGLKMTKFSNRHQKPTHRNPALRLVHCGR